MPVSLLVSVIVVAALLLLPRGAAGFDVKLDIGGPILPGEDAPSFLAGHDVPFNVTLTLVLDEVLGATVTADLDGPNGFKRTFVGIPLGPPDASPSLDTVTFGPATPTFDVKVVEASTTPDTTIQGTVTLDKVDTVFVGYGFGYKGTATPASITIDGLLSLPTTAPSGHYTLKITVDNDDGADPTVVTVTLTVRPFQTTTVPEGWSTFSIPIRAELATTNGRFYATENLHTAAQNGQVDPDDVEQAFRFNAATQQFELIIIGASSNAPLLPTEAIYVESKSAHDATLVYEDDQSGPPARPLSKDWNLFGLALPLGQATMAADDALISVFTAPGGVDGYSIVLSPSINPDPFILTRPVGDKALTVERGYWVFMENADTLAGFSTTPVVEP